MNLPSLLALSSVGDSVRPSTRSVAFEQPDHTTLRRHSARATTTAPEGLVGVFVVRRSCSWSSCAWMIATGDRCSPVERIGSTCGTDGSTMCVTGMFSTATTTSEAPETLGTPRLAARLALTPRARRCLRRRGATERSAPSSPTPATTRPPHSYRHCYRNHMARDARVATPLVTGARRPFRAAPRSSPAPLRIERAGPGYGERLPG